MFAFAAALLPLAVAEPPAPKLVASLEGHTSEVYCVAFSPDGKRLASVNNREVKVWDVVNNKELFTHLTRGSNAYGVAFSPCGKKIAVSISKQVRLFDAATGQDLTTLSTPADYVFRVAFSPCGKYVAGAGGINNNANPGHVHVWEVATGKEVHTLTGHTEAVLCVNFSADGKYLISGSGYASGTKAGEVRLWQMPGGKAHTVLRGHTANVYGVAVSPDGRRVVSSAGAGQGGNAGEMKLWEASSTKEVMKLQGHTGTVYAVAFSPDGRRLVSAGQDKTLRVWDALTGKELGKVDAHDNIIYGVAFHPDGRRVATAGQDRRVRVWDVGAPPRLAGAALKAEQLDACWKHLAGDGAEAFQAVWTLTGVPAQTLPLFRKTLKPAVDLEPPKKERAVKLVRDLGHRRFNVREAAARELAGMGEGAIPLLKKALEGEPSLDLQRRAADVLDVLTGATPTPEMVQALRAVEVLEHIGTTEARELLQRLADGLPGARLTEDARASLSRLIKR